MADSPDRSHEQKRVFRDAETGREVWQMTQDDSDNVAPYMYCQALTPDERYLCFESNRTGGWRPYRLEIETGETRRLADLEDYARFSFNMRPGSTEMMFRAGQKLWGVDVETSDLRLMADFGKLPDIEQVGGICVADAKGERLAMQYQDQAGRRCIAVAATADSDIATVFRREEGLQHILINPTHPHLVSFAVSPDRQNDPDDTHARRARAWLLDTRTGEARPNLVMPPGYRATHEYWAPSGERLYFHKKTVGSGPGTQWIPTWINSINLEGEDEQVHFESEDLFLGHSCINRAETRIISDEQRQGGRNVLLDVDTQTMTGEVVCWPNLELKNELGVHVHPSLSPSERFAVYTSNVTGRPQVYMVPL